MSKVHKLTYIKEMVDLVDETNPPGIEIHGKKFVQVVRCKDCYYCATEKSFGKEYLYCDAFPYHAEGDLIGVSLEVNPDHFCSWGERREDADE